jgi:DNA-binding SARP family transcriptional activator
MGVTLEFRILGPLDVVADGVSLKLGGAKQQVVLAALLHEPNRVVSVDRLIEWVWSDELAERNATLQVYVSNLRRLLAPLGAADERTFVVTRRPGYLFQVEPTELDSLHFETLRGDAATALQGGSLEEAAEKLRRALALWRGEPLAGLPLNGVARGELSRLDVARTTVREQLAQIELDLGRHQQVVDELRGWVSEHPLDERLRALLMLALYRCGRQAEALAAYSEGRELLVEQLGIDPSKDLRDLEQRILDQDPALDLARRPVAARPVAVGSTVLRSSVIAAPAHLRTDQETFPLQRGVTTIGRLPDRDVVLTDPGASRTHGEIRSTPDGFVLVDSASANGTHVGGVRVREHRLQDGDVIRIGDTELVFVLGPPLPD